MSKEYGLPLNPDSVVADLSVGERQRVEIVRCLLQEPQLIIMDEPTSVLTPQEADDLFVTLKRLASEGCSILYISHRLEEVRAICHHATILRHGKVVTECDPQKETANRLASLMVGSDVHAVAPPEPPPEDAKVRLSVSRLSLPKPHPFAVDLREVSLDVRAGEIVGIAGIAGNGQDELFGALSGERLSPGDADIRIDGANCGWRGITARRRLGAAFVPEERLGHGAVPRHAAFLERGADALCDRGRRRACRRHRLWRGVADRGPGFAGLRRAEGLARPRGQFALRRESPEIRRRP